MHSVAPPPKDPLSEPEPWNAIAHGYDDVWFGQHADLYEAAIELIRPESGDRILDLGAGPGTLAIRLARRVGHVVAVDFAEVMIERLRGHIMRSRVSNVEAKLMNGEELDFEDSSFDAAISMFGLCHFDDRKRGLEEMLRVVVPGGKALTASWAAPEDNTLLGVGQEALRVALPELATDPEGLATQDPQRCARELEAVGFEPVSTRVFDKLVSFGSLSEYWHLFERSSAPLALLARRLGPDAYASAMSRAQEALLSTCGDGSFELRCAAILAWGERPLSAA